MKMKTILPMIAVVVSALTDGFGQPVITKQPTNQTPYVGSTVTFSVIATGSPPPTYQWRFNGTALLDKTNSSFSLGNAQFTNAGPYSVVVSNDGGSVTSETAWLSVLPTNVVNLGDLELRFGVPTNLTALNTTADEQASSISTDGLTLFFDSNRPGGSGSYDIWTSTRSTASSPWGPPVNLGSPVNSASADGDPRISADGLSLYFDSARGGGVGGIDLWVVTRQQTTDPFEPPVSPGPPLNSVYHDYTPALSADSLTLVFASTRPGGSGGLGDLWISTRTNSAAPWEPPRNLGSPLNTANEEGIPVLSPDGLLLFFMSDRQNAGTYNVWVSQRATTTSPFGTPVRIRAVAEPTFRATPHALSADGTTLYYSSFARSGGQGGWDLWQINFTRLPFLSAAKGYPGHLYINLWGRPGATYEIQTTADLNTWTPWATIGLDPSDVWDQHPALLEDSYGAPPSRRFYRAVLK